MLEFDGLRKSYGTNLVLDDVSFTVAPGQMYGFCGANGAGKTTTMRIALGLARADAGEVRWKQQPVDLEVRRRIGYMPEERGLYPKMPVVEQLEYFGRLHGMNTAAARKSASLLLEGMGLGERSKDALEKLSLGNQQRVQLAAALVSNPDVLILDEPFSGLDPTGVDALAANLAERRSRGVPVLFSSHQLDLVERLCDAVGILAGGKIVASGTVGQLREREANRQLRVVIPGSDGRWARELGYVRVDSDRDGEVLLQLDDPGRDQDVLSAAMASGPVSHFGWRQPTLVEIFRETVAA
ncbi:MAG: ATP-binding cassette domain-containing protein [Actinomycetota bacterium]|jgi:ABC-2 type transport system ATP-binding protein|nr:ATP-binding cassette domain-containing protein [Actinomycetota bacterium]